jgi:hypothetical protein
LPPAAPRPRSRPSSPAQQPNSTGWDNRRLAARHFRSHCT